MDPHWKPTDHGAFGSIVRRSGGLTDKQISERRLKQKKQQDKEDAEALRILTENQLRARQAQRDKQSQRTEQVRGERELRQKQKLIQKLQSEIDVEASKLGREDKSNIDKKVEEIKNELTNFLLELQDDDMKDDDIKENEYNTKMTEVVDALIKIKTEVDELLRKQKEFRETALKFQNNENLVTTKAQKVTEKIRKIKKQNNREKINIRMKELNTFAQNFPLNTNDPKKWPPVEQGLQIYKEAMSMLEKIENEVDAILKQEEKERQAELNRTNQLVTTINLKKEEEVNLTTVFNWYEDVSKSILELKNKSEQQKAKKLIETVTKKAYETIKPAIDKFKALKKTDVFKETLTQATDLDDFYSKLDDKLQIDFKLVQGVVQRINQNIEEFQLDEKGKRKLDIPKIFEERETSQQNPSTVQGGDDPLPLELLEKPPLSALYLQKMHLQEPSMEKLDVDMSLDQDEVDVHVEPSSRQADTLYCSQPYESSGAKVRGNPHGGAPYKGEAAQKAKEMASQQARRDRKTEYLKNLAKAKAERRRNKVHGMESSEGVFDKMKKKAEKMAKEYGKKGKEIVDAVTDIAKTMEQENPQEVAACGMDSSSDESDSGMKLCDECGEMDDHFHVCAEVCEKPPCLTHGIAERKMSELSI